MFDVSICKKHFVSNNGADNKQIKTFIGQIYQNVYVFSSSVYWLEWLNKS